jgi:hypothetical protein
MSNPNPTTSNPSTTSASPSTTTNSNINTDVIFQIFTNSNVVIILWFLAVYFTVYLLINIFRGKNAATSSVARWIDIVSLFIVLIYLGVTYFNKSDSEKKQMISDLYVYLKSYLNSPLSLISVGLFIFTLYVVVYILELPMDFYGKPVTISIVENAAWLFFVIILFSVSLQYITGVKITDSLDKVVNYLGEKAKESTSSETESSETSSPTSYLSSISSLVYSGNGKNKDSAGHGPTASVEMNEVFNVGNNMFTYDDAQSVCASFGARLATYDEIESVYNKGGEWCNYGWSDNQSAYFPTQKSTWQNLQKSESKKHSCGRPGVNGGYFDNPNLRFGANCFGKKPKPSPSDLTAISTGSSTPKTPEDLLLEKKIAFWNANRDKLLKINSYNKDKWSMY